ncbi:alpha/beta hydrolase [Amycolatopsis minnesotensis]|uniref:AB hydrolase-1 domain-containing protein n=1 Tax=Amycolatopsis minnesotensis TaxID=337894 RepID=A0ABN2SJA4_9PSEU
MSSLERQVAAGLSALAGLSVASGMTIRRRGRGERARRHPVHRRADGTLVEFSARVPDDAGYVVLFESGLGMPHEYWDWVCAELPGDAGYFRYNRPGYGLSTPRYEFGLHEHFDLVDELRDTHIGELPVVLAGHSLGGYLAAAYAAFHRGTDLGIRRLVLVDATNIRQVHRAAGTTTDRWARQTMVMERIYALTGLNALSPASNRRRTYPDEVNRSHRAFLSEYRSWATAHREYRASQDFPELGEVGVPVDVVTVSNGLASSAAHRAAQAELLELSAVSEHHFVQGAEHESVLAAREYAAEVARVIARSGAEEVRDAR